MIDEKMLEELKEIFVLRRECHDNMDDVKHKFANDDKRLAVIESYQRIILGVLGAVGVGVLAIVLNVFSGGVA